MKKNSLLLSVLTGVVLSLSAQAQTSTLKVLADSLPNGGYGIIESFNNKLYTLPSYKGGEVNEINTTTGALTHVATLPALSSTQSYVTATGNFIFLKGKTVAGISNSTTGGSTYHIAASLSTVDTLLRNHNAFSSIMNIDTMAYILATPNGLGSKRLYVTNLINPIVLIDTNIHNNGGGDDQIMQATTQKKMYYVVRNPTNTDYILKYTNGISKTTLETLANFAYGYGFSLIGEVGSDLYYTTFHRTATMDTTWIKKCDNAGFVTIIDTIVRNSSFPTNNGLVMSSNKLIIPFTNRIMVYDLTTHTKMDILPGKVAKTWNWSQDFVAKTHFYFSIPAALDSTYISDGTVAGTLPYKTSMGDELGANFETYDSYQTLGNKAIICDEYPIANRDDELYIGNATNAVQYKLYPSRKSFPSHFEKLDGAVFFTVHDAAYKKITLMKLEGCDTPTTNPLAIKETLKNNAIICSVYPNPSNCVFNIDTKADLQSVAVYNMLSAKVFFNNEKSTIKEIDLSSQSSGIYFIKMMDKNGAFSTQKIQLVK